MTATDFANSKYKPMAFSMPFGANSDSNYVMPKTTQDASNPNFLDGFPVAYSAPKSGGGKYVTRLEMNGIGNLASRYEFFTRAGGVVTFDQAFATAIGGYPSGAILDYYYNGTMYKAVSLVDNNMVDFNAVGIDGVNWQLANVSSAEWQASQRIADISASMSPTNSIITYFIAKRTGPLLVSDVMSITDDGSNTMMSETGIPKATYRVMWGGYSVGILNLGAIADPTQATIKWPAFDVTQSGGRNYISWNANGWCRLNGNYQAAVAGFENGNTLIYGVYMPPPFINWVTQGNMYCIAHLRGDTNKTYNSVTMEESSNTFDMTYKYSNLTTSGSIGIAYGQL